MNSRIPQLCARVCALTLTVGLWLSPAEAATVTVDIVNFAFSPDPVSINVGDTVTWVQQDTAAHTATSDTGVWNSPTLSLGQSFSFTFKNAGSFPYHCAFHGFMTGTINVAGAAVNQPPTVSLTSPSDGTVVAAPFTGVIQATAADSDGTVTRVDFTANGTSLGSVMQAPFNLSISNLAAGTYSITATATDDGGATTTSSPVTLIVDAPPTVSITSPPNGTTVTAPFTGTLQASASDNDGSVASVVFFANGVSLGSITNSPFDLTVSNVAAGNYTLTAVATDNKGLMATSAPVSITISAPIMVAITSPTNDTLFVTGTNVTLVATAAETGGSIAKVAFFQEHFNPGPQPPSYTLLGAASSPPYSLTLTNVQPGFIHVVAQAQDSAGATNLSAGVRLIVYTPAHFTSINRSANGAVQVNLTGTSFVTEFSPNLQNWTQTSGAPTQNPDGSWTLLDSTANTNAVRFYRARHVFNEVLPL